MKNRLFSAGNLTALGGTLLGLLGAAIVLLSVAFSSNKFTFIFGIFIGVLAIAFASASLKSLVLGIKPFTNDPLGWRKAKESYKKETLLNESDKADNK